MAFVRGFGLHGLHNVSGYAIAWVGKWRADENADVNETVIAGLVFLKDTILGMRNFVETLRCNVSTYVVLRMQTSGVWHF